MRVIVRVRRSVRWRNGDAFRVVTEMELSLITFFGYHFHFAGYDSPKGFQVLGDHIMLTRRREYPQLPLTSETTCDPLANLVEFESGTRERRGIFSHSAAYTHCALSFFITGIRLWTTRPGYINPIQGRWRSCELTLGPGMTTS